MQLISLGPNKNGPKQQEPNHLGPKRPIHSQIEVVVEEVLPLALKIRISLVKY